MFAYYYALFLEGLDPATYRMFSFYCSPSESERNEVGHFIETQLKPFQNIIGKNINLNSISNLAPFILEKKVQFCTFQDNFVFSAQLHIFHKETGIWMESFPRDFQPNKRQLYFFGEYENAEIVNLEVILEMDAFFLLFGYFCFYCKKHFLSKKFQHMCKSAFNCFACRRPLQTSATYVNRLNKKYFCNSSISVSVAETCLKCNMRLLSETCKNFHVKNVCRFGWSCIQCGKYSYKNKFFPTHKAIERNHICGMKVCFLCGISFKKSETHPCPLQVPVLPKVENITFLGFLDCQLLGQSEGYCKDCLSENPCTFCMDNKDNYVNVCSIVYEQELHGFFHYKIFADFPFSPKVVPNSTLVPYSSYLCSRKRKAKQSKIYRTKKVTRTFPLEEFLTFLFSTNIRNTTFLLFNNGPRIFEEIVKCLLHMGIVPKVIAYPQISFVEIKEISVRFVNMHNFFDMRLTKLAEAANVKETFFPLKWNKKSMYSYVSQPPLLNDLFDFDDTWEEIEKKKAFIKALKDEEYNFCSKLIEHSKACLNIIFHMGIQFLKTSFISQDFLYTYLEIQKKSHTFPYVHPFQPPIFTKAAYAYKLLLTFCKEIKSVIFMRPPINMQSSIAEIEYCAYLRHCHKGHEFQDAWSPCGQKHYFETFPDSYSPSLKTAFFFNGCVIHGHCKTECKFQRSIYSSKNFLGISFEDALNTFEEKVEKLKRNHPEDIRFIEIQWECEWLHKKKTDKLVIDFLKNSFTKAPNYRLEAHATGKSCPLFFCQY